MVDDPLKTPDLSMNYIQETANSDNLPPHIPSHPICKNMLLIDSRVREYDRIISSINNDTKYIIFDYAVDTIDTLKTKIAALSMDVIVAVGIVQDNYLSPNYQWLSSMQPALLQDIVTTDASLNSWTDVKDFCSFLKNDKGTEYYDLLACNTYSNPDWVYALNQLETACGMDFRASSDTTGWGGNWILESDNVDLTTIYFTHMILQWQYTLASTISVNTIIDQTFCNLMTNWPCTINAGVTITFAGPLSLTSNTQWFQVGGDGVTIDGAGYLVTLTSVITSWSGLVSNNTGKNNCTIKNIGITTDVSTGCLIGEAGYICQKSFGRGGGNSSPCTNNNIFNCYNTGTINGDYCSGIFGSYAGADYGNVTATNCYNTGTINGNYNGGIFCLYAGGYNGNATAINCYNTGPMNSIYGGGLIGHVAGNDYGNVTAINCYNTGPINVGSGGGILAAYCGYTYGNATATNCYNTGTIITGAGGISGTDSGYNNGKVNVINCYVVTTNTTSTWLVGSGVTLTTNTNNGHSETWNDTTAKSYLTGHADGASNVWLNLDATSGSTSEPFLLTYNCAAALIIRFTTLAAATTAFSATGAVTTKPTITALSGSTITFTPATCNKNVITNYKYSTSNDGGINWSAPALFFPALTSTATTATIPSNIIFTNVKIQAVNVVDGPVSDIFPPPAIASLLNNSLTLSAHTAPLYLKADHGIVFNTGTSGANTCSIDSTGMFTCSGWKFTNSSTSLNSLLCNGTISGVTSVGCNLVACNGPISGVTSVGCNSVACSGSVSSSSVSCNTLSSLKVSSRPWTWIISGNGGNGSTNAGGTIGIASAGIAGFNVVTTYGGASSSSWNITTAIFTAPTDGLYQFQLNVFNNSGNAFNGRSILFKCPNASMNSTQQYCTFAQRPPTGVGESSYNWTQTIWLSANDSIWFVNESSSSTLLLIFANGFTTLNIVRIY